MAICSLSHTLSLSLSLAGWLADSRCKTSGRLSSQPSQAPDAIAHARVLIQFSKVRNTLQCKPPGTRPPRLGIYMPSIYIYIYIHIYRLIRGPEREGSRGTQHNHLLFLISFVVWRTCGGRRSSVVCSEVCKETYYSVKSDLLQCHLVWQTCGGRRSSVAGQARTAINKYMCGGDVTTKTRIIIKIKLRLSSARVYSADRMNQYQSVLYRKECGISRVCIRVCILVRIHVSN